MPIDSAAAAEAAAVAAAVAAAAAVVSSVVADADPQSGTKPTRHAHADPRRWGGAGMRARRTRGDRMRSPSGPTVDPSSPELEFRPRCVAGPDSGRRST